MPIRAPHSHQIIRATKGHARVFVLSPRGGAVIKLPLERVFVHREKAVRVLFPG